ncbi:hypothetical protein R3P38DRAFT_2805098 [Favolaschia claudopus]|uniref:Uncharacterized protein n=1 Tax=Favolaschia claudopus TaxID=2862362 RepID=A0AAV9ZNW3_9AGAR
MSHPALPRASLIPLDNLLGVWLLGVILSAVLFGITCNQMFLYFTKYVTRDSVFLRTFVIFLFVLDSVHLALISHSIYRTVITNFGDYVALQKAPWSLLAEVVIGNLISTMVQLFYAVRIYTMSKKSLLLPIMIVYLISTLSFVAAADLLISCTMIYLLFRSKTGFKKCG